MLAEPRLSNEDAARLVEAYERNDTSASEYLALVTENRPFTPTSTMHAVINDSGTYCTTVAMPVIFNSFLQDHGNVVVQELLSRYEVVLVEKHLLVGYLFLFVPLKPNESW
ncbi:Pol Polyprotein [Phytophthora cinnamomi]|uniref:Pol Polyprotein n=1 Tax=Phytophthora cinnamomi TaxID=4785 RepID=UPI00355AAC38|nr:Pol Polyprotein [Phytophthora cinnamomi]